MTRADDVDAAVRGMLLAFEALGTDDAALPILDDRRREACAQAKQALDALAEPLRARRVDAWRAEAREAVLTGVSRLHPSWVEEALVGERAEIAAAVRSAGPAGTEAARALARLAFGHLLPLCEGEGGPLAERLCDLGHEELLAEVARHGARVVGRSLSGAEPVLRARAMAYAGEPWAQEIAAGAMAGVSAEERAAALAFANAARAAAARTTYERFLAIGLAALKEDLERDHPASVLRVAGRLPAALGRSLVGW
jgi:hypothetical protein